MIRLILCFLWCFPLLAAGQSDKQLTARLDSLLQEAVEKDLFSGVVLVARSGVPVYEKAVGKADLAQNIPNTAATTFQIGSISKLFTKIILLRLAADNKLKTTDLLGQHLDGFPPEMAEKISIEHLMQHQSGLGQYYEVGNFMDAHGAVEGPADILPWIRQEELQFEPGTQTAYSNSGYVLLAAIAEKVSGRSYAALLQQYIFDPLGMLASGFSATVVPLPGKAVGYQSNMPGPLMDHFELGITGAGDGGIYATAADLLRLHHSLATDNRLLSDADKLRLFNEAPFTPFSSWETLRQKAALALAGGAPGISAVYAPDFGKDMVVVVLSNYDEGSAEQLFRPIRLILSNKPRPVLQLPPAKFIYKMLTEKGGAYFTNNIDKALEENGYPSDDDMILLFAGQALIAERKTDEALALYQYYTRKFPKIIVAWNDLGDVYRQKNDPENAKMCYRKALELRPGNPRATRNLEQLEKK